MAHDVEQLRTVILHSEYETAQEIREACRQHGYSLSTGYAIAYRAGLTDAKQVSKDHLKKVYRDLAAAQERVRVLELALDRKQELLHLLAHPEPSKAIEDVIAEIDADYEAAHNQPTPGVNEEEIDNA